MNDSRTEQIQEILLDEGCDEENLEFARKYKVTATPTLVVIDESGEKIEEYEGGVPITQNIVKLLEQYA